MKSTSKTTILFTSSIIGFWCLIYLIHFYDVANIFGLYQNDYSTIIIIVLTVLFISLSITMNYVFISRERGLKKLRVNEQKLEEILENTNEWIWELDAKGVLVYSSKMVYDILGYSHTEVLLNYSYSDFFTDKYKRISEKIFSDKKRFVGLVSESITKNGKTVWLKHTGIPLFDDEHNFLGYRGISKDYSEQKAAKDTLDSLSKTFSAVSGEEFMFKMSEHISSVLGASYVYVGELNKDLTKVNIITGIGNSEKIIPFEYSLENSPCSNAAGKKLTYYPEKVAELFPKDKFLTNMKIESYLSAPIFDKESKPTGILVVLDKKPLDNYERASSLFNIFLEKTSAEIERIKSQRALAKSEETFRNIFNNSPIGMFQSSLDGQYIYNCNSQFCKLVGYSLYELTKIDSDLLWINKDKRTELTYLVLSDQIVKNFETELLTKNGDLILVSISLTVYKDQGYIEGAVNDITDAKLIENTRKAILKLNNESIDFTIEQIFAKGLSKVKDITHSESVFYYLLDENENTLPKFISINSKNGLTCSEDNIEENIDRQIFEECIKEKTTCLNNNTENNSNGFSRILYVPIVDNDTVVSIIGMSNKKYNYSIVEADQIKILAESIWNIALKKQVDQQLKISETNFRTFFESVDSFIFIVDFELKIVAVNNTAIDRLEYEKDQLVGQKITHLHSAERISEATRIFNLIIFGEETHCNIPLLTKSNLEIEVETTANVGFWNGQKVVIAVCKDISLIKNSEKLLENSEKNLHTFFDTVDNLLFVLDNTGKIISVNVSGLIRLGYDEDEVIGKSLLSLYSPSQKSEAIQFFTGMIEGKTESCTLPLVAKSGTIIPVEIKVKSGVWNGESVLFGVANDLSLLKESEEKFSSAFHSSSVIMSINSAVTGQFYDINNTFTEVLGYTRSDVLGKNVRDLQLFVDENSLIELNKELHKKGSVRNFIQEFYSKDKKIKIGSVSINIITLHGEQYELIVINDITQLKEAELALIESEDQFRSLAENTYDIITRYDNEFKYLYVNKSACKLTGLKFSDIIGKKNSDLGVPHKLVEYWENGIKKVFETGVFERQVFEWNSDSGILTFDGRLYPEFDEKGDVKSVLCVSRDITEKKNVEKELEEYRIHLEKLVEQRTNELTEVNKNLEIEMKKFEESEEKFRALAENAEDTIMRFDRSLKHMYVNPVVEKQTGIDALEFIGKTHEDLGFPEHLSELWEKELVSVFNSGVSNTIEFMLPNGLWIDWSILPEFDEDGEVSSLVTVGRDITNRKNMELKVEEALKKEKELNELKSKFISTASHEFRTPLTAIMSSTELLERYGRKWEENQYKEHIERILKSVDYLTSLMDDILIISRADSGKLNYFPAEMDLQQLFLDVINDISVLRLPTHILNFQYNLDEKMFVFDKKLLSMVFLNLLSNAIKYSPNGGKIDIKIDKEDTIIKIEISDEGIGIPEKDLNSLFEAFHRAENVNGFAGTGLGLSIVKTSVELHNGIITVKSKENEGTKFTIKLPIQD